MAARVKEQMEAGRQRGFRSLARRTGGFFLETGRTYWQWWPRFLLLAAVILIPVNLAQILIEHAVDAAGDGQDLKLLTLFLALLTVTVSSLLGEVLLAGTIALSLSGSREGKTPTLKQIARDLKYGRLIALDLAYVSLTLLGMIFLIIPGLLVFTLLALAGPVVEIEHRTIRGAFRRSARLVRTDFWLVFWVLLPISVVSDLIAESMTKGAEAVLGHGSVAARVVETLPEILLGPFFAIAVVLLTLRMIERSREPTEQPHSQAGPGLPGSLEPGS